MFYVYILQSLKDRGLYIGYSNNLKRRISEHKNAKVFSTKSRLHIKSIYYQTFVSKIDAIETEKYLKTTSGWKRIKRMLKNSIL